MKIKSYLLLAAALALLCCCITAAGEEPAACSVQTGEEWSWSRGAYNTFSGTIDLSGCSGEELTIVMTTDLVYDEANEQKSKPVFTTVNGKRIAMTKQSGTVKVTPDPDSLQMEFTGSLRLPEKGHYSEVAFAFTVSGADGSEQKSVTCRIGSGEDSGAKHSNNFYIPVDISKVTLGLGIAAAAVWMLILALRLAKHKSKRTGE